MNTFHAVLLAFGMLVLGLKTHAQGLQEEFVAYWYAGKAELSTYHLEQFRYGEQHKGKSILVFVTEDFLVNDQVKNEHSSGQESTSVLKLNRMDRFVTGIYDYSLMSSVFQPVDIRKYPKPLKTTFSAQDWCGQSYLQFNYRKEGYQVNAFSYFESEGDAQFKAGNVQLEDALWSLARIEPRKLPQGEFELIPSSRRLRLEHEPILPIAVQASLRLEMHANQAEQYVYVLRYPNGEELRLFIQSVFPYRILGWEERLAAQKAGQLGEIKSRASLDTTILDSYWAHNKNQNLELRKLIGLGQGDQ